MNCRNPEKLSTSWREVLGYVELSRDGVDIEIGPESGLGGQAPTIVFALVADKKTTPLRLHLDVSPVDRDQDAELDRLLALGAPQPMLAKWAGSLGTCLPTQKATNSASSGADYRNLKPRP